MSSTVIKSIGTAVAGVLASLAATNTFPALTPFFGPVATLLVGWLHLPQPGASK